MSEVHVDPAVHPGEPQNYVDLVAAAQAYASERSSVPASVRGVDVHPEWAEVEVVFTLSRERFPSIEADGHHQAWWRWSCSGASWRAAIDGLLVEVAPYLSGEKPMPPIPDITPERRVRIGNRYDHALEALGVALRALEQADPATTVIEDLRARYRPQVALALSKVPAEL